MMIPINQTDAMPVGALIDGALDSAIGTAARHLQDILSIRGKGGKGSESIILSPKEAVFVLEQTTIEKRNEVLLRQTRTSQFTNIKRHQDDKLHNSIP
jgi:hypothetical protein